MSAPVAFEVMPDSAIGAVTELAASQHSVISRSQAAAFGLSRARIATFVRQGWLIESSPGVLVIAGSGGSYEQRVMAAVLAVEGTVASHRTAARLHRLDGFERMSVIDVSVDRSRRRQRSVGVEPHHVFEVADADVTTVSGIPTTTIPRTLADLGAVVTHHRLVERAVTDARRRGWSVQHLQSVLDRHARPGPSGTGVLQRILDRVPFDGVVTDSWFEEVVARCLEHPSIGSVVPQFRVVDEHGEVIARVDLAIPDVQVAVEAHSRRHHFGPHAERLDETRDVRLAACGWEVIYVGWHQAKTPDAVAEAVAAVVQARRSQLAA